MEGGSRSTENWAIDGREGVIAQRKEWDAVHVSGGPMC